MLLTRFQKKVKRLTQLPDGKLARALVIALNINGKERSVLFKRLENINDELREIDDEAKDIVEEVSELEEDIGKLVKKTEREEEEELEKQKGMQAVEEKLNPPS